MRTIKIAFVAPLTGDQSIVANPMLKAAEMAVDNFAISDMKIQILGFDDQADSVQAEKIAKEIADNQEIIAVIGNKNSSTLESAGKWYEENQIPFLTPSATNFDISQKGWKGFFRLCSNDKAQAYAAAKFACDDLRLENIYVFHDETEYGLPLSKDFTMFITEMGANIVSSKLIETGTKDVTNIVEELKKSNADGVFFALTEIESSILAKEMKAQGAPQIMLGTDGSPGSQFLVLSGSGAGGAYMTYAAGFPGKYEKGKELLKQYKNKFGEPPVYSSEIFDVVELIANSLKDNPQVKREELSTQIRKITPLSGSTGLIEFDEFGNRKNQEVSIWQVRQGEMEYIKSFFK